jgi:hypothetical protein
VVAVAADVVGAERVAVDVEDPHDSGQHKVRNDV